MTKRSLRIAQVLPRLDSGGVEKGTIEVSDYLIYKGHKSFVISGGGRLVKSLILNHATHIKLDIGRKSLFTLFLIPRIIKIIRENKIDIVHVRSRFPAWIVYIALKIMRSDQRPFFVTTVHGYNSVSWYSRIMTKGDRVIAVSQFIKNFIINSYHINEKKIDVIYRGVSKELIKKNPKDFDIWKKAWQREFKNLKNKKILSIFARVSRTKGIETFIEIISRLVKKEKNIHALIVGESKSETYLKFLIQLIQKKNLEKYITFTGFRYDSYEIMQYSDISYCLSTVPEPFGRVVVESIKLGTPVIGYNIGGCGEQLKKIFPEGIVKNDISDIISRTNIFLKYKPKIQETKMFSLEKMVSKTLRLYLDFYK